MPDRSRRPVALTIGGSDPGGGAGIQADLKTFAALGVYGFSAISAVIAQNSNSVDEIQPIAPALVSAQIRTVVAECKPKAVKIGMLANAAIVRSVARTITDCRLAAPVVDPVMVASAGGRLLDDAGRRALRAVLIPLARIVTPNIPEAESLTGVRIDTPDAIRRAAREMIAIGARAVVIKGGHLSERGFPHAGANDLFYDGRRFVELRASRIPGGGAHGTGCAFSAAIAAFLARGSDLEEAVRSAKRYLSAALEMRFRFGAGRAVLDHFAQWKRSR